MTIADRGARTALDPTVVDEFRAIVARLGVMTSMSTLFGTHCPTGDVWLPHSALSITRCDEEGEEQWLIVAGVSDVDPWVHVDTAPPWVQQGYDITVRPALVAWGQPGAWETSAGRQALEHDGILPPANRERPWLTDHVPAHPALTDRATISYLTTLFPTTEPDLLDGADVEGLAETVWNTLVTPHMSPEQVAASLRAFSTHLQLAPIPVDRIEEATDVVTHLWHELLPGHPRPVNPAGGHELVAPRRAELERTLMLENRSLMWGWAVSAMIEAACGTPPAERTFHFDEHGLRVRAGEAWARLVAVASDRYSIVGESADGYSSTGGRFERPTWVPDLERAFGGTVAWTIRGLWRGTDFTGPLHKVRQFSATKMVKPNQSVSLPAALSLVPEPAHRQAQTEVVSMMQGLQDFTWGDSVLAVRPAFGSTPSTYSF